METRTLIKDTATVARVTQLVEGDAYRRLIPKSTYETAKIAVGVVTGVLNNGESIAITALEVKEGYGAEVESKVFEADADLALFPADPTEVDEILSRAQDHARRMVTIKERDLGDAREKAERIDETVARIHSASRGELTTAADAPRPIADSPQA